MSPSHPWPAASPARRRRKGLVRCAAVAASLVMIASTFGARSAHADENTRHYEGTYTIGEDGSVAMKEVQTISASGGCPGQQALDEEAQRLAVPPKTMKAFDRDGRCGYTATWSPISMSKARSSNEGVADLFTGIRRDGSELHLTLKNKLLNDPTNSDVTWTFVFPEKIDRAQGARIDGNRATWTDMRHAPAVIHVDGHLKKDFPWLAVILSAVGAVVVIAAVVVILLLLRRKRRRASAAQPGQWGQPVQAGQPWPQPPQPGPPGQSGQPVQPPQPGPPLPPSVPPGQQPPWQGPPPQA